MDFVLPRSTAVFLFFKVFGNLKPFNKMSKVRKLFPATEQSGEFCNYLECEFDGQSKAIISISSSPIDGAPVNFYLDLETAIE